MRYVLGEEGAITSISSSLGDNVIHESLGWNGLRDGVEEGLGRGPVQGHSGI